MASSVQVYLQEELNRRKLRNLKYSLRAMARDLGVSPSFLSLVLKGKRRFSIDQAVSVASRLKLSAKATKLLVASARVQGAKNARSRSFAEREQVSLSVIHRDFDRLETDQFAFISDWYHLAILELVDTTGFVSTVDWVAKRLGISKQQASDSIDRMVRLKLLELDERGVYVKLRNNAVYDAPSAAIRAFHRQHLKNAESAIESVPFDQRHLSGITISMNPKNYEKATNLIRDFRSQVCALLEKGDRSRVYHLAIQLFPLDREN